MVSDVKVMVTGSRGWTDEAAVCAALEDLLIRFGPFELLHGGAEGADTAAYWWAMSREDVSGRSFLPDYALYGNAAPHVRNDKMLELADFVVAFWDGKSRGTKSVIDKAVKRGIAHEVHKSDALGPLETL